MYVIKPNSQKFELIQANRLGNSAFASPAISGDRLLLRVAEGEGGQRQEVLYCVGFE